MDGVARPTRRGRFGFVAVAVLLVLAVGGVAVALTNRSGSVVGGDPTATTFYPLFGNIDDIGLNDPYVSGNLETLPSGRELPSISAADAEGGRPMVASLRITDRNDIDPNLNVVPVTVNGVDGLLHTDKATFTDFSKNEEIPKDYVDSIMAWPITDQLWAVLQTTLRPDEKPADLTRRIAESVTYTDPATWADRFPFSGTPTTPPAPLPETTTSGSLPEVSPDGRDSVSTTAGP